MTTVFLSGSRKLSRINDQIRCRIQKMLDQEFVIVLGDANGADKAMQGFLAESGYRHVTVFCAGQACRNNLGAWDTANITVPSHLSGRDFYAEKDKEMAAQADYGFVLWDGKSSGSINNVIELVRREKSVVVYLSAAREFFTVKTPHDINALLNKCEFEDYQAIIRKTNFNKKMNEIGRAHQGTFGL